MVFKIEAYKRILAKEVQSPDVGDTIEFMGDQFTDKGPATGEITRSFVTVDGPYITVKFSDSQQTFSWDDLTPYVKRPSPDHWSIEKKEVN
jgi:hypothetical protein